jgi:excisionase family DNA binding protein
MSLFNAKKFFDELEEIKSLITVSNAEFIGIEEASKHLRLSKTYLYSLVHKGKLPFYKPNGKKIYFNKIELNDWIAKSKIKTTEELESELSGLPLTSKKQLVQNED